MASEHIEPALSFVMGHHFEAFKAAKDSIAPYEMEHACCLWWQAILAMNRLVQTLEGHSHAKIACTNGKFEVRKLIKDEIGYDPMCRKEDRKDGWTLGL
jgi:hypothetical protein